MTGSTVPVRDGLPTAKETFQALAKLQIPLDRSQFENMAEDRRLACLLAVLNAWATPYASTALHASAEDVDQYYMVVESAQSELEVGSSPDRGKAITLNTQVDRLRWTEALFYAIDRDGNSLGPGLRTILQGLIGATEVWRDAHAPESRLDPDFNAGWGDSARALEAMELMAQGFKTLAEAMRGPQERP